MCVYTPRSDILHRAAYDKLNYLGKAGVTSSSLVGDNFRLHSSVGQSTALIQQRVFNFYSVAVRLPLAALARCSGHIQGENHPGQHGEPMHTPNPTQPNPTQPNPTHCSLTVLTPLTPTHCNLAVAT